MAYRRRQGITRASTFNDDIYNQTPDHDHGDLKGHSNGGSSFRSSQSFSSHSSLAAQAIRASSNSQAFLSFLEKLLLPQETNPKPKSLYFQVRGFTAYLDATKNESRGLLGILAQKSKSILEEDEEEHKQNVIVVSEPNPRIRNRRQFRESIRGRPYNGSFSDQT